MESANPVLAHGDPRGPNPSLVWVWAVAGAITVAGSVVLALTSSSLVRSSLQAFLVSWITIPYIASGLLAWWRRPASRLGLLMLATGLTLALTTLQWSDDALLHSVGHLLDMLPAAMFLHVFLAFPDGRLNSWPERLLVAACYVVVVVLQVTKVALGADPASLFALTVSPAASTLEQVQLTALSLMLLAGVVLLMRRSRGPYRPARRSVALLVDAFGLSLVMLAVLYVAAVQGWPQFETIRSVTFAALGLAPVVFLVGLLDARLARSEVGDVLVLLRQNPDQDLQALLARALHDPSLTVAYWVPEVGGWADHDGSPTTLPGPGGRRSTRIVYTDHKPVAALLFDRSLADEHELLDAVGAAAGIALDNGRLHAELRAQSLELRGSRVSVAEAGLKERQRLERNLHDGAQQRLVALSLELGRLIDRPDTDPETRARLDQARDEVAASLRELRDVARGMYPAVLSGHGLSVALESLAARAPLPLDVDVRVDGRLPEPVEVAAYYVVSESLANIGKHAGATHATLRVAESSDGLVVEVDDDGVGGADAAGGTGLRGLTDRVEELGGTLLVSTSGATGTLIRAQIPCR